MNTKIHLSSTKKPYFVFCLLLGFFVFCEIATVETDTGVATDLAFAQQEELLASVEFPIPELGNCGSKSECKEYCDLEKNFGVCLDFAEAHNLLPKEQIEKDKRMLEVMRTTKGPGGCQGKQECDTYCSKSENMEECIIFGKEHGLIPLEEIKEVEQVLQAIRKGAIPPSCQGKQECDIYCSQPEHIEECVSFGQAAGFIDSQEAEMIKKTQGKGPGGCQGKEECDAFCQNPEHMKECIEFGLQYNLMLPEEIEEAEMMLQALSKGVKPPPCQGKEECDIYCSQPEHMEECVSFGEAAGFITPEEAEQMRKMSKAGILGGPGKCQGKEECEAYCNRPENMEECVDFSVKAGFMDLEEAERIKKMNDLRAQGEFSGPGGCQNPEECDIYCQGPAHMEECMKFGQEKGLMSPRETEQIERLFQLDTENSPGGCQTPEECKLYCDNPEHMEECLEFGKRMGLMEPKEIKVLEQIGPGGPGGPGKCQGKQECDIYCSQPEHIEECANFFVQQGLIDIKEAEKMGEMMGQPHLEIMKPMEPGMPPPDGEMPMKPDGMMKPMEPGMPSPDGEMPMKPEGMMLPPDGMMKPMEPGMPPPAEMLPKQTMDFSPDKEIIKPDQGVIITPNEIMPAPMQEETPMMQTEPKLQEPQSLLDSVKNFLASIIFGF